MVHLPQLECPYSYLTTSSQMWGYLIPKTIWMLVPQGKLCWPTQGKRGQRSCMKHYSPSERTYQKGGWDMSIKWQAPVAKICLTSVVCRLFGLFFPFLSLQHPWPFSVAWHILPLTAEKTDPPSSNVTSRSPWVPTSSKDPCPTCICVRTADLSGTRGTATLPRGIWLDFLPG